MKPTSKRVAYNGSKIIFQQQILLSQMKPYLRARHSVALHPFVVMLQMHFQADPQSDENVLTLSFPNYLSLQ